MQLGDRGLAVDRPEARLQELADERVVALVGPRPTRQPTEQGQPFGRRGQPGHGRGIAVADDLGQLGRDDLQDRGVHEEPLELLGQVADHLLGQVVVHVVVGAVQRPHEPPDLRRRPIAQGGMHELQRGDPALRPLGQVDQHVRLELPTVGLVEQLGRLGGVEAQRVRVELGDLTDRPQPRQRERRRATAGEHERSAAPGRGSAARGRCAGRRPHRRRGARRRGSARHPAR